VTAFVCALFFVSGAAGLVFETLWFRQAGLAFGNGVWASSLVLSSFMAGLALGNGIAARVGHRVRSPVRAYALLEAGIAVAGVALVHALPHLTPALADVLRAVPTPLGHALRAALGFALLLVPATAMGATLPLLVGALRARDPSFGASLGRLYGWNTLGAVAGALAAEWLLLEALGVRGSAWVAAGANGAVALAGLALGRGARFAPPSTPAEARAPLGPRAWGIALAATGAGAILLALEVVWFRFLHLYVHSGSAAFACMLAVVLAGIGAGGVVGGALLRRRPEAWRHAPGLALAAGVLTAALYAAFSPLTAALGLGVVGRADPAAVIGRAAVLAFPVALLSGVLFPLLGVGLAREVRPEIRAAGLLTLGNTVGAAAGSLLAGFVLLPALGVERSLFALALAYGAVALCARPVERGVGSVARWAPRGAWAAALLLFPFGAFEAQHLRVPVERWHGGTDFEIVDVREGRTETAVLVLRRRAGEPLHHFLLTDSFAMSGTSTFSRRYMKLFVYWPLALRPEPQSALLISYGVGSTAAALVETPSLETIDVVDVSRDILELSGRIFAPRENPLRDPRVRVHVQDGRHFLQLSRERYDLVTAEPPPPKNAGIVNLYTREYFALIRERLAEGGVATYWLPVHNLTLGDARSITRAFCDVFEDCSLWVGHDLNWMLAGSRDARWDPTERGFRRPWRDPGRSRELRDLGLGRPELLGATFLGDAEWLRARTADAAPLTDDFPKRLSDTLQTRPYADFLSWMDTDAARERFRESAFVRAAWPRGLRERTLAAFDTQAIVNAIARREPLPFSERLAQVDALLAREPDPTFVLWRLGLVAGELRAIEAALARGAPERAYLRERAVGALAAREFDLAARRFGRARERAPHDPTLLYLELYALCRDGRVDEARALAAELLPRHARDPDAARVRVWLAGRFAWNAGR